MSVKLLVLYPTPADPKEFDRRYEREHLPLGKKELVGATGLASHRILGSPAGKSPFARLTEISFPSLKAVQETGRARRTKDHRKRGRDLDRRRPSLHDRRRGRLSLTGPAAKGPGLPRPLFCRAHSMRAAWRMP
jgi:uncharacterized protein (TIGR02118 family)